jgi:hypothetical protein
MNEAKLGLPIVLLFIMEHTIAWTIVTVTDGTVKDG